MKNTKLSWLLYLFIFLVGCYSFFSYGLTDPNLVLVQWQPYWQFQQWMWHTFFENRQLLTGSYLVLVGGLFLVYGLIIKETRTGEWKKTWVTKEHWIIFGIIAGVLSLSYNALSHDVFNYIFNAKLVVEYQQNPHVVTALEYPDDLWTRFMHNTHTAAPYGYGWTALSLLPFLLGMGKFLSTWVAFRVLELGGVGLTYAVLQRLSVVLRGRELYLSEAALLFLNPLFLLEVISNMHNDLWMMVPALAAMLIALEFDVSKTPLWKAVGLSAVLLAFSLSVKYATVLLLPVLVFVFTARNVISKVLQKKLSRLPFSHQMSNWVARYFESWWKPHVAFVCSVLLFIPLFTGRSQIFHPWYLLWSLCWIPLLKDGWWKLALIAFSLSSLLRYIPWLWVGNFEGNTLMWQQVITWTVPVAILAARYFLQQSQKNSFSLYNE